MPDIFVLAYFELHDAQGLLVQVLFDAAYFFRPRSNQIVCCCQSNILKAEYLEIYVFLVLIFFGKIVESLFFLSVSDIH